MGRLGEADDIARVAGFLASADSDFMTGMTIKADGGRGMFAYRPRPDTAGAERADLPEVPGPFRQTYRIDAVPIGNPPELLLISSVT